MSMRRLAYVEWDSDGRVCRAIQEVINPNKTFPSVLDRILYEIDRPHRLDEWDVEWCKRDECYYAHESGSWGGRIYLHRLIGGRRHTFWAEDHIQFCRGDLPAYDQISDEEIARLGYDRTHYRPAEDPTFYTEVSCEWCPNCEDMIPIDNLCDHMTWCQDCGWVIGPDDKPCPPEHAMEGCVMG